MACLGLVPVVGMAEPSDSLWGRETLADGLWGIRDRALERGIDLRLGLTSIAQANTRGGMSTHRRRGRLAGSYDIEMIVDTGTLGTGTSGVFYVHAEGGWSRGIGPASVGSAFGVNADALGDRGLDVVEAYYRSRLVGPLGVIIGKLDSTAFFDTSAYANDQTTQFLNGGLVNNPAIPFPNYGLGLLLSVDLLDRWQVLGGALEANVYRHLEGPLADLRDNGHVFYVLESIYRLRFGAREAPLDGTLRFGLWVDPRPKAFTGSTAVYHNDVGFYVSADQMLLRENAGSEDGQGLGVFGRYGWADERRNDITGAVSGGFQYQGLLDGRDKDVLALGFAYGEFSDLAAAAYPQGLEAVTEMYYKVCVTPWMQVTPQIEHVVHPGGAAGVRDAWVVGVRAQVTF